MIRKIQHSDLDELRLLCREHADYEQLPFEDSGLKERWQSLFFSFPPKIYVWVLEVESVQGYMSATIDYATWSGRAFVYMDCLYLRPAFRGSGFGKTFMETLQAFSRQQSCAEMQWHTPPHNTLGMIFYHKIGALAKPKVRYIWPNAAYGKPL